MTLRALQAPLKQQYRAQPQSALVRLSASARVAPGVTARVETGHGPIVTAGLHPATGGDGTAACSAEMLLQALVACAAVTLAAVATSMGVDLRDAAVTAEGDWDARGTLAITESAPVGFAAIRMRFALATDALPDDVDRLVALTERYCVVLQTLRHPPTFEVDVRR